MNLLVVSAGYIGSHIVLEALKRGYKTTVFDELSTGNTKNINDVVQFIQGTTLSNSDLSKLFEYDNYDFVIHLAGSKAARDSMSNPLKYATTILLVL